MRKDPTEFRKRFQSWKLGMPAYEDGKPIDYTKAAQESRDREYNTAMSYFKSTPNVLNIARGVYHFAKSTPLFGDTPASVNPNMIYGDAPAVGYRNATNLAETTRRIKAAVKPFVNGVSNTKLSTQALQQEIRYGDTYYPEQLTIAERNAMPKLRLSRLSKQKDKYVMVDNAPKVGLKNYILMENGRPLAEMIASMEDGSIIPEMVYKTNKAAHHTTTDLYSGILKYQKQAGNKGGLTSGENYKSTPTTLKQVKKFKKEKISDNGVWDNEGLVGYDQEPTLVKTMEEADRLNKKGKAFIMVNQPVYRLLEPVKDIPIKDRYMFDPRRIGPNGEYNIDMSDPSRFAQNQDDSNQRHYFRRGKDLPRFRGGSDGTRYVPTDDGWGRITDSDVANLMLNFVATPYGVRNKFNYEYNPNYRQPIGKNAIVRQDNDLWTRLLVEKANNTRTWRSDAADVAHAIGEGAMLASTFAAPEVENLVYPAYQAAKSAATNAMRSYASKVLMNPRNFLFTLPHNIPFEILNLPGYLLKTLMRGNPLEKQLSKTGTISVNSILALANKASDVEKNVINNVLSKKFAGQKTVDYNEFRRAVLDDLITYDVTPDGRYEDYGISKLGFNQPTVDDMSNRMWQKAYDDLKIQHPDWTDELVAEYTNAVMGPIRHPLKLDTYTFSSPRIPNGSDKHYDFNTLGHSRTYTTGEEPDILHVMESQSDWAQENIVKLLTDKRARLLEKPELMLKRVDALNRYQEELQDWENMVRTGVNHAGMKLQPYEIRQIVDDFIPNLQKNIIKTRNIVEGFTSTDVPQAKYLTANYQSRQIQENLKHAAEKGQTKMRYPTPDTAAKIEGYTKRAGISREMTQEERDEYNRLSDIVYRIGADRPRLNRTNAAERENIIRFREEWDKYHQDWVLAKAKYDEITNRITANNGDHIFVIDESTADYMPEHKTILKKYADFPKQYKKLYKDADVRTITDSKGNTWYEVDVPKNYLNSEWQYGLVPWIIGVGVGSGTVGAYANESTGFKNGKDIYIKPSHRGRFTALKKRTGHSASWFKAHGTPALKKMATFELNARKWHH